METPTPTEIELIHKFRIQLSDLVLPDEKSSDFYLLRWIRGYIVNKPLDERNFINFPAREHRLKDAEEMFRKHLNWHRDNKINEIWDWEPPSELSSQFPFEIVGRDNIGCPVVVIPMLQWNIRKAVDSGLKLQLTRYVDKLFLIAEKAMQDNSSDGAMVTQIIVIFDFKDFSFWQLASVGAVDSILEAVRRFEANHPETLHSAYCINASRVFSMLFKIIKPFLSPRTLNKVQIHQSDPNVWRSALRKRISVDQLPVYFGGTGSTSLKVYNEQNDDKGVE